jgi:glycosidase
MAQDTPLSYRSLVIYEVYTRNHSPAGNFAGVTADLERLKGMGVDIVWLMPIHPIGKVNRKGTQGSSYAIANYREVNPEYGAKADFANLIEKAHSMGLRVMIDVVFNHTAPDSNLAAEHPDWYHQNERGEPVSTVPDWSDVIDLKFPNPELEEYLIDTLIGWAQFGVDGFRCDVASLLPIDFWLNARRRVATVKPGVIWLAETVHTGFVSSRRASGLRALSDGEIYHAFDLTYDYDIWPAWQAAVTGETPVSRYLEMLRLQDSIYPANYVKMRCVENHDQARIMRIAASRPQALAWTAFEAFNQGAWMMYSGQETAAVHTPNQFEIDPVQWTNFNLQPLLMIVSRMKKSEAMLKGRFSIPTAEPAIVACWESPGACLVGIFNVSAATGTVQVNLPDGDYLDMLNGPYISIKDGIAPIPTFASIFRYSTPTRPGWFHSPVFDTHIPRE